MVKQIRERIQPALMLILRRFGLQASTLSARAGRTYVDELVGDREALAIEERILGRDHPEIAATLRNLATALDRSGDVDEAIAALRRAAAILRRHGEDAEEHFHQNLFIVR